MSAVDKTKQFVGGAAALAAVVALRVNMQDDGRVKSVKILGGLPLFQRVGGKARILGIRAKRFD